MSLLLALTLASFVLPPNLAEPEPVTVIEKYGPVIDRAEATELGLFKYRQNFGVLRFVRADAGRLEARVATSLRGTMLEQAVVLDSPAMARVWEGVKLLRDRGVTNVEMLLSPTYPLDASVLGPAAVVRAGSGAACLGLLGLGVGMVVGTRLTWDEGRHETGWPEWRTKNLGVTAAIAAATTVLGGYGGWHIGRRADAGRAAAPRPGCAIAGYDDDGFPIYEEQVRAMQSGANAMFYAVGSAGCGLVAAIVAGAVANQSLMMMTSLNDPNGLGSGPVAVLDLGIVVTAAYLGNTIGRNMDRQTAVEMLRHRPRPQTP
jgi:hypothetical protein